MVVASGGVHSALRTHHAAHFGSELRTGRNHYTWLGTTKVFDAFGYGFGPDRSTCVVECAPETFTGLGLDRADEAASLALLEKLFADTLDGHALIGRSPADGSSPWLNFRTWRTPSPWPAHCANTPPSRAPSPSTNRGASRPRSPSRAPPATAPSAGRARRSPARSTRGR